MRRSRAVLGLSVAVSGWSTAQPGVRRSGERASESGLSRHFLTPSARRLWPQPDTPALSVLCCPNSETTPRNASEGRRAPGATGTVEGSRAEPLEPHSRSTTLAPQRGANSSPGPLWRGFAAWRANSPGGARTAPACLCRAFGALGRQGRAMRPYHLLSSARNGRSSLASRHAASGGAGASAAATPLTRLHGAAPHTRCPRFALFSHW